MSAPQSKPAPALPDIRLELVEDISPEQPRGFLRLVRRRYVAHYPDGTVSQPFVYDEVDRKAIDAVVIVAHFARDGARQVYLRSAMRPPVFNRDPERSPIAETSHGGLWEVPAGLVEVDEQSETGLQRCAARELGEELGFKLFADSMRPLGPSTFPSPGVIAERHFYFEVEVDPDARSEPELDGSALEHNGRVVSLPLSDALELCRTGAIEDGKTELALRRLAREVPMSVPRVVVVAKRSAYSRFIEDEGDPRARALVRRKDPPSRAGCRRTRSTCARSRPVERVLDRLGARAVLVRHAHAAFDTADAKLVIAVGGDGTLLAASHNVGSVPILGVNSAPKHSVGFFCAATRKDLEQMLERAFAGREKSMLLTRMAVVVNGRVRSRRVLNEALYCHASPAATSRYILRHRRIREEQRSSGFWIGPAAGSTAAQRSAGGKVLPLGSKKLQLVVREPYSAFNRRYRLLRVLVDPGSRIVVQSQMQQGCMFLDGPYKVIDIRLGDTTEFYASDEPLRVVGLGPRRHRVES